MCGKGRVLLWLLLAQGRENTQPAPPPPPPHAPLATASSRLPTRASLAPPPAGVPASTLQTACHYYGGSAVRPAGRQRRKRRRSGSGGGSHGHHRPIPRADCTSGVTVTFHAGDSRWSRERQAAAERRGGQTLMSTTRTHAASRPMLQHQRLLSPGAAGPAEADATRRWPCQGSLRAASCDKKIGRTCTEV